VEKQVTNGDYVIYHGSQGDLHDLKFEVAHVPADEEGRGYVLFPVGQGIVLHNVHRASFTKVADGEPS
jgi:hypothetical protein